MHFVSACPRCGPALDAFDVYVARPTFRGRKMETDTLGKGLNAPTRAAIASKDFSTRFNTIQKLIQRWVRRRLELSRPTDTEWATWEEAFSRSGKRGTEMLYRSKGRIRAEKHCAICDGAVNAADPDIGD